MINNMFKFRNNMFIFRIEVEDQDKVLEAEFNRDLPIEHFSCPIHLCHDCSTENCPKSRDNIVIEKISNEKKWLYSIPFENDLNEHSCVFKFPNNHTCSSHPSFFEKCSFLTSEIEKASRNKEEYITFVGDISKKEKLLALELNFKYYCILERIRLFVLNIDLANPNNIPIVFYRFRNIFEESFENLHPPNYSSEYGTPIDSEGNVISHNFSSSSNSESSDIESDKESNICDL